MGDRPAGGEPSAANVVQDYEHLLAEWFERPVILLSSGRTGIAQLLAIHGFSRHHDTIWVPPYLSRCVLNALTYNAFPSYQPAGASAAILYDQIGFRQRYAPDVFLIEDLAHAFFSTPLTGSRSWRADSAIFSLPKFFPTAGLVGGVITDSPRIAEELRNAAAASAAGGEVRRWMSSVFATVRAAQPGGSKGEGRWLDAVYELLYTYLNPEPPDLVGMPTTMSGLREVGTARAERVDLFVSTLGGTAWPDGFVAEDETVTPFALPYFGRGEPEALQRADAALAAAGIEAGIYHVDVRRDMANSEYRPCLLLPCHQAVPVDQFLEMCNIVKDSERL
jgi:hypothetical protein